RPNSAQHVPIHRIAIAVMVQSHRADRANHRGDRRLHVTPPGLGIVRNARDVATRVIAELPIGDLEYVAEGVLVEIAIFDRIDGDVLLSLLAPTGPDHPARGHI